MSEIKVSLLTVADGPALKEHLSKAFCMDEPILNHLQLDADPEFLNCCVDSVGQNISLKATNENGEIVGAFISDLKSRTHHNQDYFPMEEFRIINGIVGYMDQAANIFGDHPDIDSYVDGVILSVDKNYRSHGIGSKLFTALIALCRERNVPILKTFCSSFYTSKICEKFGMKKVFDIPYRDIQLDNLPSIDIAEPHSIARVYTLDFRQQ